MMLLLSGLYAQNVGIGTSFPTTNLDVNGSLRIRQNSAGIGAVLTSVDANGNTIWGKPVAFRTSGLLDLADVNINSGIWTKVIFNSNSSYNMGLGYQPNASQFQVIDKGIYHFDTQLSYSEEHFMSVSAVRIRLYRNGATITLVDQRKIDGRESGDYIQGNINMSFDYQLLSGDIVWVEVYCGSIRNKAGTYINTVPLSGFPLFTWFNGFLVART